MLSLIHKKRYFVLHAPLQTGKTSALLALRDLLNGGVHGRYRCVYVNVEAGQAAREGRAEAKRAMLSELEIDAEATLNDRLPASLWPGLLEPVGPAGVLRQLLARSVQANPVPLVLLIDEIDTLIGDTLIAVLRQLTSGSSTGKPGPQLLLQAFLQRIVKSGGRLAARVWLGRMRTDLLIVWPAGAPPDCTRRMVIECKVLRRSLDEPSAQGWKRRAPTWTAARPRKGIW